MHDVAVDVETEDTTRVFSHIVEGGGILHPTGFPATTGVDLSLDHHRASEPPGSSHRRLNRKGQLTGRNRHVVAGEQFLALVLEQVHRWCLHAGPAPRHPLRWGRPPDGGDTRHRSG